MHQLSQFMSPQDRQIQVNRLYHIEQLLSPTSQDMKTFKYDKFDPKMNEQIQVQDLCEKNKDQFGFSLQNGLQAKLNTKHVFLNNLQVKQINLDSNMQSPTDSKQVKIKLKKIFKCEHRYSTKCFLKKLRKSNQNKNRNSNGELNDEIKPNYIQTENEEVLLHQFQKQSKQSMKMVKDQLQLKTIEVCVNSENEHDTEEERTFQKIEGFVSQKSEINVNLEEADFESQISSDQTIQQKIAQLQDDIASIKQKLNQTNEQNSKVSNENDVIDKYFFGNEEEDISSKGMNAVGTSGCTASTTNPGVFFVQTQDVSTCTFTQVTNNEQESYETTPKIEEPDDQLEQMQQLENNDDQQQSTHQYFTRSNKKQSQIS